MSKQQREGGNQREKQDRKGIGGRKSKYHTHIEPYIGAISAMCRNGATLDIIAERFKVATGTLLDYKNKFPEFRQALIENNEIADFTVENALYENAVAGNLTAQIFWLKNRRSKQWRDKQHVFQASTTVVRKDYENMTDEELEREEEMLNGIVPDEPDYDMETDGEVH